MKPALAVAFLACLTPMGIGRPAGGEGTPAAAIAVERQPLIAQVERLADALRFLGAPLSREDSFRLAMARDLLPEPLAVAEIQAALDPHCLAFININPESRVKVERGPAPAELVQGSWRVFLVRVRNEAGVTAKLQAESRHARLVFDGKANAMPDAQDGPDRWMGLSLFDGAPMKPNLSGLDLEYRIVEVYSRDAGKREGQIAFNVGQGTQDIGFRNDISILFRCAPAVKVGLRVHDETGAAITAGFTIRDSAQRVYPYPGKRIEPDFHFHDQVYRADGESVELAPGRYTVTATHGPEFLAETREVVIADAETQALDFTLQRWVNPNARGWFSGDHHIHAAGCLHYRSPTQGVTAESMMRHVEGEGLNVGCVLTWGPCWYHQKTNFTGLPSPLSTAENILRYDVEVSGFPSDHCGHLVLLRLKEDDYPGAEEKQEWPSWDLPILKWAKAQGGVVGVAHSGLGLNVAPDNTLPNYVIPPMDSIGAQEYLVDVVYDAVDFISTVDTPAIWELNIWYHTLNCGFRTKISGETDFPCIYGDRVGMGRSYVKMDGAPGNMTFDHWVAGVKAGRSYVSDGLSHLMDFTVDDVAPGGTEAGELKLAKPGTVKVRASVAARLQPEPLEFASRRQTGEKAEGAPKPMKVLASQIPYFIGDQIPVWHLERARINRTRNVPVEIIVNGQPVARREIAADGSTQELEFDVPIERSSWVAVRILYSSHTNPVFVSVADQPIRASKRSAQWCLDSIDKVWKMKSPNIREAERGEAETIFENARRAYRTILDESRDDRPAAKPGGAGL